MLTTLAVALLLTAVALPRLGRLHDEGRCAAPPFTSPAAAAGCAWRRCIAAPRSRSDSRPSGSGWLAQSFLDGDWDGVRSADIAAGRDPALSTPARRAGRSFPARTFGFVAGCPLTDGTAVRRRQPGPHRLRADAGLHARRRVQRRHALPARRPANQRLRRRRARGDRPHSSAPVSSRHRRVGGRWAMSGGARCGGRLPADICRRRLASARATP